MTLWNDKKWVARVGLSLDKFGWKTEDVANFRCPVCGDSKKNPNKKRGYFYPYKDIYVLRCHNCGASMSLKSYIKQYCPALLAEYITDNLRDDTNNVLVLEPSEPEPEKKFELVDAVALCDLKPDHPARAYMDGRKVPSETYSRIFYTEKFRRFVLQNQPEDADFHKKTRTEERIIFPIKDLDGGLLGFNCRAMDPDTTLRYQTILFDSRYSKLYGRESLNIDAQIYVTEGPMDSLFLDNAVALCGGDVSESLSQFEMSQITLVLDNEPRSKDTIKRYTKAIEQGYKTVIWKSIPAHLKDINDMILEGYDREDVRKIIDECSFQGLRAKMELASWKKI